MDQRLIGIIALVIGVVLLVMGFNASESVSSEFSEFFTGNPSDKAIWYLIGGAVVTIFGLASLRRRVH